MGIFETDKSRIKIELIQDILFNVRLQNVIAAKNEIMGI
jgi:hypothetical protein